VKDLAEPYVYRALTFTAPHSGAQVSSFCESRALQAGACTRLSRFIQSLWIAERTELTHGEIFLMSERIAAALRRVRNLALDLDMLYYLSKNLDTGKTRPTQLMLLHMFTPELNYRLPHTQQHMVNTLHWITHLHVAAHELHILYSTHHRALAFPNLTHLATYRLSSTLPIANVIQDSRIALDAHSKLEMLVIAIGLTKNSTPTIEPEDWIFRQRGCRGMPWWEDWSMLQNFGAEDEKRRVFVLPHVRPMKEEWDDIVWGGVSIWERAQQGGVPRTQLLPSPTKLS
jgi:hypothetical protein